MTSLPDDSSDARLSWQVDRTLVSTADQSVHGG